MVSIRLHVNLINLLSSYGMGLVTLSKLGLFHPITFIRSNKARRPLKKLKRINLISFNFNGLRSKFKHTTVNKALLDKTNDKCLMMMISKSVELNSFKARWLRQVISNILCKFLANDKVGHEVLH